MFYCFFFFFFKQKTAYEMLRSLVGSEMCIRDRYEMAKMALHKYTDLKKKAEDESTRAHEKMAAYLKYKELMLKSADEGDDAKAAQYERMSNKYLESYKDLESSIQTHGTNAKAANDEYQRLSAEYEAGGKDVEALKTAAAEASKVYRKSEGLLEKEKTIYQQASQDKRDAQAKAEEVHHQGKLEAELLALRTSKAMRVNQRFQGSDKQTRMLKSKIAVNTEKIARYREISFELQTKSKHYRQEALAHDRLVAQYNEKLEASTAASKVFADAYEDAGCGTLPHRLAQRLIERQHLTEARQEAAMAMDLAEEELDSAKLIRDAALRQKGKNSRLLGETDIPKYRILYEEFMDKFEKSKGSTKRPNLIESAKRDVLVLLQSSETANKGCEHTKQVGQLNFHIKEAAAMQRDHHKDAAKLMREKEESNLSGISSTAIIVRNLKAKNVYLKTQLEAVLKVRLDPCTGLPDAEAVVEKRQREAAEAKRRAAAAREAKRKAAMLAQKRAEEKARRESQAKAEDRAHQRMLAARQNVLKKIDAAISAVGSQFELHNQHLGVPAANLTVDEAAQQRLQPAAEHTAAAADMKAEMRTEAKAAAVNVTLENQGGDLEDTSARGGLRTEAEFDLDGMDLGEDFGR
eukprot:TRINITY_DN4809_c0_g1_i4.p1 TRINITY_DN4809_c0_g1~~TRINITY_DN4809_c0_g1_i4.p1  ORF type:complete len:634 (-),score=259.99 TRINITY_DN4809_c0_g1_i4:238-2139(-)